LTDHTYVTLIVGLNGKVVGLTELGKAQRIIAFLCAVIKVVSYGF
jgi:hypothetical protein